MPGQNNQKYVIMIHSRDYGSWNYLTSDTYNSMEFDEDVCCNPAKDKLFSRDVISWPNGFKSSPKIEYSPTRNQLIAAVLELETNKTYGRSQNGKRLLYKCIPNDRYLPAFLVPYSPKIEFNKKQENKFVLVKFDEWKGQHPLAKLEQVIGHTSDLNAFYEYQLHSRSLITNDGFANFKQLTNNVFHIHENHCRAQSKTIEQIIIEQKENNVEDRSAIDNHIFTIDPRGSSDFDDAFCVTTDTDNPDIIHISVYISSVYVWMNRLNLWPSFSLRVSTIYLPDYRRPMIPALLSEQLCSLVADGNTKFAVQWNISVNTKTGKLVDTSLDKRTFIHSAIKIAKNYCYDSPELETDIGFQLLKKATVALDKRNSTDSHDVVAFWMVRMNSAIGKQLATKYNTGIFRRAGYKDLTKMETHTNDIPMEITGDTRRLIGGWKNTTGVYCLLSEEDGEEKTIVHDFLDTEYYIHITSPIRRIVDLLNQILFLNREFGVELNEYASHFLEFWTHPKQVEYINATMRSIRKVQMDCDTVAKCYAHPEWMQHQHQGVVFDRIQKTDATFSYMVYLPETKVLTRIHSIKKVDNYTFHEFVLTISPIDHVIRAGFSD